MEEMNNQEIMENNVQEEAAADSEKKAELAPEQKRKKFLNDAVEIAESTLITIFALVLVFTYLLHPVNVVGSSMVPTLNNEDRLFMSMIPVGIKTGDIIVIDNDAAYLIDKGTGETYSSESGRYNECIIKRVIACGGQTLDISSDGSVYVDGELIDEPYINSVTNANGAAFTFPLTVPEGYYFVMGDNRQLSADSRDPLVGLIKQDQIYGKAVMRYFPDFKFI